MTALDRALFSISLQLIALRIPARKCNAFMQALQGHVLQRPKLKPIQPDGEQAPCTTRLLLLDEGIDDLKLTKLPDELRDYVVAEGGEPVRHSVTIGYDKFSAEQVLRRLLPEGMEVPSAFEQVGHVAHMNLREEHLPYKALIGEVLLDKNPRLRSVVNKVESISNEFRVFPMEVIAGDEDLETTVRENGATFALDYREVYWNSRLEREHRQGRRACESPPRPVACSHLFTPPAVKRRRIVDILRPGEVVCDMMAGIGPFAVPAALKGNRVYANDLNPQSAKWLRANVLRNKVGPRVRVSNSDARAFLRQLLAPPQGAAGEPAAAAAGGAEAATSAAEGAGEAPTLAFGPFSHILMNLPASALNFLDALVGAFDAETWHAPLPRVHCYCFSKETAAPEADVIRRAEEVLGCTIPGAEATVVRDVAPNKLMLCVSFVVPEAVAWRGEGGAAAASVRGGEGGEGGEGVADLAVAEAAAREEVFYTIWEQTTTLAARSRAEELEDIANEDLYQRYCTSLLRCVSLARLREGGALRAGVEGRADTCIDRVDALIELRATRLSQETKSLPAAHFFILFVFSLQLLVSFLIPLAAAPATEDDVVLRGAFAFFSATYTLVFNFAVDLNDPFTGNYQIRRSAINANLVATRRCVAAAVGDERAREWQRDDDRIAVERRRRRRERAAAGVESAASQSPAL